MKTVKNFILYEDNHIIIVNKLPSEIVQGDKTGDDTLTEKVKAYIKEKYDKPGEVFLGVPHRIDRPVSGAVIFARTSKALVRLNEMFKEHTVNKTYWAVVTKRPPELEATLVHYILKNEEKNRVHVFDKEKKGAKEAKLSYKYVCETDHYILLEIKLYTGRHHQIRAQLSRIGCPIKGDLKYGANRSNEGGGIHLHSRYVEFVHPVTKALVKITAPVPEDNLWKAFEVMMR